MNFSLLSNSKSGFNLFDDYATYPEFIGKVTLNPSFTKVEEGAETSYSTYKFSGTIPNTTNRAVIILWYIPSSTIDAWYVPKQVFVPIGGSTSISINVLKLTNTTMPALPEGYVFALGNISASTSTYGMRVWNSIGTLVQDSGLKQLSISSYINNVTIGTGTTTYSTGTSVGKLAHLIPQVKRISEVYAGFNTAPNGLSTYTEYNVGIKNNNNTISLKLLRTKLDSAHAADTSSLTGYSEDNVYGNNSILNMPNINAILYDSVVQVFDVSPQTYSIPTSNVGASTIVDGATFNRSYIGNSTDSCIYSISSNTTIPAIISVPGFTLNNSNPNEVSIGSIKIPGDLLRRSSSVKVSLLVTSGDKLFNCQIAIGLSKTRTAYKYKVVKYVPTNNNTKTVLLEFLLEALSSSKLRVTQIDSSTAPTSYPNNAASQIFDANLLSGVEFPISVKYMTQVSPSTSVVISASGYALCYQKLVDTSFSSTKEYRKAYKHPFVSLDMWNSTISPNVVARAPLLSNLWSASGDSTTGTINATGTQGSDILNISRGSNLLGTYPVISFVKGYSDIDVKLSVLTQVKLTRETFGVANKVIEVINSTSVRLASPLLLNVNLRGNSQYTGIPSIVFYPTAETLSIQMGVDNLDTTTSMDTNIGPLTGITKTSNQAIPWKESMPILRVQQDDLVKQWSITSIVGTNPWIFKIPSNTVLPAQGETISNCVFYMKTPILLDNNYIDNADRDVCVITEDGMYSVEVIGLYINSTTGIFNASRAIITELNNTSVEYSLDRPEVISYGISVGTRAYGGGLLGGVVRSHELARCSTSINESIADIHTNIRNAMSAIPHAISMSLSSSQVKSNNYCPNISNQASKSNYYSFISQCIAHTPSIVSKGSGYKIGDVLYIIGGSYVSQLRLTITSVSSTGEVLSIFVSGTGQYRSVPSNLSSLSTSTSGLGSGCTINAILLVGAPSINSSSTAFPISSISSVFEYPATTADANFALEYSGACPMGSLYTIDPKLNLFNKWKQLRITNPTAKSSSYEYLALLSAIQKYGAFCVDITFDTHTCVTVSSDTDAESVLRLLGMDAGDNSMPNMKDLKSRLLYVENMSPLGKGTTKSITQVTDLYPTRL